MYKNSSVIMFINKNLLINGILFYCIEHYLYLCKKIDIKLYIIFDGDINIVKNIIKEKYYISETELKNIIHIKKTYLLKHNFHKVLILDTETYNNIKLFSKKIDKIFLYSNDAEYIKRPQDVSYGFYDYQKFDIKERLKLGFQFMKPKKSILNKSFCSALIYGFKEIDKKIIENKATYKVIYKNFNKDLDIFNFKEIIYYHTHNLDRNNRIIPEAYYFGNKLILINNKNTNDSVNERYNMCKNNSYKIFQIDNNYILINDFLKY